MLDPFAQLSPTLLGPRKRITHGLPSSYGLHPSHDLLQIPILLGAVASICTPLPTRTQQLPTLLAQLCWELEVVASVYTSPLVIELQILARLYQRCLTSCHLRLVHTRQKFAATHCGDTSQRQISVVEIL